MLALALQLGPCRVEHVTRLLLRVRGGADKPEVVAAIKRAGGELDGTRRFWWLPARNLRSFAAEMRREADPLFRLLEQQKQREADAGEREAVRR